MKLTIEYNNGEKDQFYVNSCYIKKNCLIYNTRFEVTKREYHIPLSSILRYSICK